MDKSTIIDALRKARVYIRSVEAWRKTQDEPPIDNLIAGWTEGEEVEAIDKALEELGLVV